MINNKKFALVLSGGASLGFAHVGVLKCLEEAGLVPDIIAGTSVGALIGGAYAMGMNIDEIEQRVLKFNKNDVFDIKFMPFIGDSVLSSKKVDAFLMDLFKQTKIEKCKIKFICTAVDINKAQVKYFKNGLLWQAVRASVSIPGIFTAFKIGDNKYMDGGVLDNLPTECAKQAGADIVVAINVMDYDKALIEAKTGVHSIMNALTIAQKELVKLKTEADLVLNLKLKQIPMMSFKSEDSIENIRLGYNQTKNKISKIKELFGLCVD